MKKGFTLIELLVTILIIAVLATYSILAYVDSIYDGVNKQAKAKLEVINTGYERYLEEYPGQYLSEGKLTTADSSASCSSTDLTPTRLVACGYVPKYDYDNLDYDYSIKSSTSSVCGSGRVYMTAKSGHDVGSKYKGSYCGGTDRRGYAADFTL